MSTSSPVADGSAWLSGGVDGMAQCGGMSWSRRFCFLGVGWAEEASHESTRCCSWRWLSILMGDHFDG